MLTSIMRMDAIPVLQCAGLLALEELSADRTLACLRLQELCTHGRGRLQCPLSLSLLQGSLPVGGAGIGRAFDLHRTRGFARCW